MLSFCDLENQRYKRLSWKDWLKIFYNKTKRNFLAYFNHKKMSNNCEVSIITQLGRVENFQSFERNRILQKFLKSIN